MKTKKNEKVLLFILSFMIMASLLSVSMSVSANTKSLTARKITQVPDIDGEMEEMWEECEVAEVLNFGSNIFPNTSTEAANEVNPVATAKARVMWDEKHLYLFVEVYDTTPNKEASKTNYEDCDIDSVDIQISESNALHEPMRDDTVGKGNKYPGNGIFNVNINGYISGWGGVWYAGSGATEVNAEAVITNYGYCFEMVLPLQTITADVGTTIGLEFQINDNQDGTGRTAIRQWSCAECLAHSDTIYLGELVLVGENGETAPQTTEPQTTELPTTEPQATEPQTTEPQTSKNPEISDTSKVTVENTETKNGNVSDDDDGGFPIWIPIVVIAAAAIVVVVIVIVKKKK